MQDEVRAHVLYVTPVTPRRDGNGLAMRAGRTLEILARHFAVHLFVVPVAGGLEPPPPFVREGAVRIGGLDPGSALDPYYALITRIRDPAERRRAELAYPKPWLSRVCCGENVERLMDWAGNAPISAVHVMRLYLAPLAQAYLRRPRASRPFCVLDLDDDEVLTRQRLAGLYRDAGDFDAGDAETSEAEKYRVLAQEYLAAFDRVLVCAEGDAHRLSQEYPAASFVTVPNCAPGVPSFPHQTRDAGPLRLLFVGTLGYYPNADAARFLCGEVLAALRRLSDRPVSIDLVGAGDAVPLRGLASDPAVRLLGYVEDLAPVYAAADVAVVPLRAGGGTRIKILEAFARGVPVVSTRIGAEGIAATDAQHLLLADDAESFARACLRLKSDPALARRIAQQAKKLAGERYSPARVEAALAGAYGHHWMRVDRPPRVYGARQSSEEEKGRPNDAQRE